MERSDRILFNKYEVSLIGISTVTILPTFCVLFCLAVMDLKTGKTNNLMIYFIIAFVFLILLIASTMICKRYARTVTISRLTGNGVCALIFTVHFLVLMKCYLNSPTVYPALSGQWFPWHEKSNWKVFMLMTGVGIVGIFVFLWTTERRKLIEIMRYPVYLLASAIAGFSMYAPNWAANDRMHGSAYYTSVYNALMNEPYTYSNRSIYGHYAILLKYPVKWMGGDYQAFNIVIAFVGALSLFFVALALDLCVRNHFVSIIAVWAVPVMFLYYPLNHWQMFPHRVIFAGIELYLIAALFYKKNKWIKFIGYFVCCISMIWNIETGIVCLGIWAITCILYENFYLRKEWDRTYFWTDTIRNIMYSVFSIIGMMLIFNLYNMLLGEPWHGIRFILYPHIASWDMPEIFVVQAAEEVVQRVAGSAIVSDGIALSWGGGFASGLALQFPIQISYWYFVFLLMGLAVILYIVRLLYRRAEKNDYIMGLAAVLALGHLTYFMNRPCFDYLAIAFFEAVMIMAVIADREWDKGSGLACAERGMQFTFVGILSVLSILTIWQTYFRISNRIEDGYYDREEFREIVEQVEKGVPKDTYAIGMGIQEIYAELGWDTQCHVTDFMAFDCTGGDALATLVVETAQQNECVVCFRSNRSEERETIQHYMRNWGFIDEAVTVKNFWDLDIDENWYWNLYYLELDPSRENKQKEHYGGLIK